MSDTENPNSDAEARIQTLIRERNQARSDLSEARAEISTMKETAETSKLETSKLIADAVSKAEARVQELESSMKKATYREILLSDKVGSEDLEGIMDYLDFQYGKLTPEEGAEKPEFKDWYGEFKKTSPVLKNAIKASKQAPAAPDADPASGKEQTPPKKAAPTLPAKSPNLIPPKVGGEKTGDLSRFKVGSQEWLAEGAKLNPFAKRS